MRSLSREKIEKNEHQHRVYRLSSPTHFLIFVLLALGVTACQTLPTKYHDYSTGTWQAKALVRNKVKKKSVVMNIEIQAEAFIALRIDATSSFGQHLASLVIDNRQITYVLPRERKYYRGKASKKTLARVLGIKVSPELIFNMLFDIAPEGKNWVCTRDKKGYLVDCRNLKTKTVITWKNRDADRKLVTLDHPKGRLQLNLSDFEESLEKSGKPFSLKIPKSFQRIK